MFTIAFHRKLQNGLEESVDATSPFYVVVLNYCPKFGAKIGNQHQQETPWKHHETSKHISLTSKHIETSSFNGSPEPRTWSVRAPWNDSVRKARRLAPATVGSIRRSFESAMERCPNIHSWAKRLRVYSLQISRGKWSLVSVFNSFGMKKVKPWYCLQ